jgi:iron complex outermembrane receptor protein
LQVPTVSTPGYAVIDAQTAHDFGRHYTLEGSAANLANRKTFDPYEYLGTPV